MSIKERVLFLQKEIKRHNALYYGGGTPEISDNEWDVLYEELVQLEKENPELSTPDSPTQNVGAAEQSPLSRQRHTYPMYSLDKAKEENINTKLLRLKEALIEAGLPVSFLIENKKDGLSNSLHYVNGELVQSVTRGDGLIGSDVTHNARMIDSIPQSIPFKGELIVTGEVVVLKDVFEKINEERRVEGLELYANPRNLASGVFLGLDTSLMKNKGFEFLAYNIQYVDGVSFEQRNEVLEFLETQGFYVDKDYVIFEDDLEGIVNYLKSYVEKREEIPFEIDGMTIKALSMASTDALGYTSKFPRWGFAYKFETEKATTILRDVVCQVSRQGHITPVAVFDPVELAQTQVVRATLHNQNYIDALDIRIGDTVVVEKGGDIIPSVIGVELSLRPENSVPYKLPENCPSCDSDLEEDGAFLVCKNTSCKSRLSFHLLHFCDRKRMDIEGLGKVRAIELVDKGLVHHVLDLYTLTYEDILSLNKSGEKSAESLINSINKSKEVSLERLLYALGIPEIGETSARKLAHSVSDLDELLSFTAEEIALRTGLGEVASNSFVDYFSSQEGQDVLNKIREAGINTKTIIADVGSSVLADKVFVVTGVLSKPRQHFENLVSTNGGRVAKDVTGKTDFLLAGDRAGSKLAKMEKKIEKSGEGAVLTEEEFLNMLNI